jgi:hypothetical protein
VYNNADKARIFLNSFFPEMGEPETESDNNTIREELEWRSLTEIEIGRALKAAKGKKTLGVNKLLTPV